MKKETQIEHLVQTYLAENFDTKLLIGQNYLLAKVAEKLIRMFFTQEADFVSKNTTTIIQQEEELIHHHVISGVEVKFKGFADRIDVVNNVLRIIDYKTGKESTLAVKEDKWDAIFSDPKKAKTLQVLLYAWLYKKSKNTTYPISSGIYWLKKAKDNFERNCRTMSNRLAPIALRIPISRVRCGNRNQHDVHDADPTDQ